MICIIENTSSFIYIILKFSCDTKLTKHIQQNNTQNYPKKKVIHKSSLDCLFKKRKRKKMPIHMLHRNTHKTQSLKSFLFFFLTKVVEQSLKFEPLKA